MKAAAAAAAVPRWQMSSGRRERGRAAARVQLKAAKRCIGPLTARLQGQPAQRMTFLSILNSNFLNRLPCVMCLMKRADPQPSNHKQQEAVHRNHNAS